jgi:hypothetical protein
MYAVLIGESGIVRKSSVIKVATGLARALLKRDDQIALLTSKSTPEALDRMLHARTAEHGCGQVAISISELASFMGQEGYVIGMPALLTDLYDCHDLREGPGTLKDGPIEQRNLWVNFIAGSTPTWLLKTVNPVVSEGGFTSRCLFICANEPKRRVAWPSQRDANEVCTEHEQMLAALYTVQAISWHRGVVDLDPLAMQRFIAWYDEREPSLDNYAATFEAREDAHVLRVAALLSINSGEWTISIGHMMRAIELVTLVKKTSSAVFARAGEKSRYGTSLEVLRTVLMTAGMDPVARGMLFRRLSSHIDHTEFMAMLDALEELGAVQRFTLHNESGIGRPTEWIRGTQGLLAPGLGQRVVTKLSL